MTFQSGQPSLYELNGELVNMAIPGTTFLTLLELVFPLDLGLVTQPFAQIIDLGSVASPAVQSLDLGLA